VHEFHGVFVSRESNRTRQTTWKFGQELFQSFKCKYASEIPFFSRV